MRSGPNGPVIDISIYGVLLVHFQTIEAVPWTRIKSCVLNSFPHEPQSVTDGVAAVLDKAKFRVCVGVRSGPKGPVIDISICWGGPGPLANH